MKAQKTYLAFNKKTNNNFAFNANSDIEAHKKINSYNESQGYTSLSNKLMYMPISKNDLSFYNVAIHNEYIPA